MLSLSRISKLYGRAHTLSDLSLEIPRGKTTVLIGHSGCGKSTVLRLMMGLVSPDSGEVALDGEKLTSENALQLRHRMGYVIQDGGLFPHLNAYDNAALMARFLKTDEAKIKSRIEELAQLTKLPHEMLGKFPRQLSGGQKQRVSLIRALMLDPHLLLLDEPMGALDPMIRSELQADLREIFRRLGKTAVLVTHDLGEASFFGDTIVLMKDGRIVQQGSFRELIDKPADPFVTAFVNAQRTAFS